MDIHVTKVTAKDGVVGHLVFFCDPARGGCKDATPHTFKDLSPSDFDPNKVYWLEFFDGRWTKICEWRSGEISPQVGVDSTPQTVNTLETVPSDNK